MADKPLDFAALKDERFIATAPSDSPAMYERIREVCRTRGYVPNVVYQYDRVEAVILSVGAGLGISILPETLGRVFFAENVTFKRIPGEDTARPYVVAWQKNITNPAAALFIETLRELFG